MISTPCSNSHLQVAMPRPSNTKGVENLFPILATLPVIPMILVVFLDGKS